MRILLLLLAVPAYGQLVGSTLTLFPKDASNLGETCYREHLVNGSNKVCVEGLPQLPSDKRLFWPSANVSTSLLGANTLIFGGPLIWTVNRAGGTEASPLALSNGEGLLSITPQIYNGSAYVDGGSLSWTALLNAGTYSSRFQISTRDNTGTVGTRMQIGDNSITTFNTDVTPGTTNTWSLGGNTVRWNNTFTRQLTVSTGAAEGVTADLIPNADRVRNLGSAALPQMWANLYIGNGGVFIYGSTSQVRGSYSGGGISIRDGAGVETFSVASLSGNTVVNDLTINGTCTGCGTVSPPVDLHLDSAASYVLTLGTHDTTSRQSRFQHSRGTQASPTDSVSGDLIGLLSAELYGGGAYRTAAQILIHAVGTPSASSSPGQITLCTTPSGATTCTERLAITPTGTLNIWSALAGGFLSRVQNSDSTGFSGFRFFDSGSNVKASVAWGNTGTGFPSTFHIGTQSADTVTLITGGASRWTLGSSDGSLNPTTDGGPGIGLSTLKPSVVWSRLYKTYTSNSFGLQENTLIGDHDVNLVLDSYHGLATTSRAALVIRRSRGTLGSPSTVSNLDRLGFVGFTGFSNSSHILSAMIEAVVDGTVSGGIVPGSLQFYTMNASGSFANRMEILPSGDVNMNHGLTVTGVMNSTGSPAYRVSGATVIDASRNLTTGNINPISSTTYDIGNSSAPYNNIVGTTLQAYASGVLRFQAAGTINLWNSSGVNVFAVTNTGRIDINGNTGETANIDYIKTDGLTFCRASFDGGVLTSFSVLGGPGACP